MIEALNTNSLLTAVNLAKKLWPESSAEELETDFIQLIDSDVWHVALYRDVAEYIGFLQLSLRSDYVEGCTSSPVLYIEGIFVDESIRGKGVATELIDYAADWGRERGCTEMASDCDIDNKNSFDFHKAIGFKEVARTINFAKRLDDLK